MDRDNFSVLKPSSFRSDNGRKRRQGDVPMPLQSCRRHRLPRLSFCGRMSCCPWAANKTGAGEGVRLGFARFLRSIICTPRNRMDVNKMVETKLFYLRRVFPQGTVLRNSRTPLPLISGGGHHQSHEACLTLSASRRCSKEVIERGSRGGDWITGTIEPRIFFRP